MRLRVHLSGSTYDYEKTILWSGSPEEVFEEGEHMFLLPNFQVVTASVVQVSDWLPRISFLPLCLPPLIRSFWE